MARYQNVFLKPLRLVSRIIKYNFSKLNQAKTIDDVCENHFKMWSYENHINRSGLTNGIKLMSTQNPTIFETGTSAYGVDSSRLFDRIAKKYSGQFLSVDINPQPKRSLFLQHSRNSKFYVDDSIAFIKNSLPNLIEHIDLCYLDSWDVDWSDPEPSAVHGLNEFDAVRAFLKPKSILIIDDTPSSISMIPEQYHQVARTFQERFGVLPGKGAFVVKLLHEHKFAEVIQHEYNLVLRLF